MKTAAVLLLASALTVSAAPPPAIPLKAPDGPVIATWQAQANPTKSYIAQLFVPGDKAVPLFEDSPADHVHHHSLMLALGGDTTDFWTEKDAPNIGTQQPVTSTPLPAGDGFTQTLRWIATDGTHLLDETRVVRVRATGKDSDAVNWIDWQSTLTPAPGRDSVKLWGRHYFGLGMRFLPEWSGKGRFVWSGTTGQATVRGDEKLTPGPWCAVTNTVAGGPVTVLMLNHPDNPRPGAWFTMADPFCYLAATYDLEKNPATLAKGERWTVRHSLAVLAKPADPKTLEPLVKEWQASLSTRFPVNPQPNKP